MAPEVRGRARGRARGANRGRGRGTSTAAAGASTGEDNGPSSGLDADEAETKPVLQTSPSATRGASASRTTRGPGTARFRPKNIRRDEASRDELARQELDKDNAKAKEEARRQARSRGRSRRSRGDIMGRGGLNRRSVASGPFSQFLEGASGRGGWGSGGGGGGGGGGVSSGFSGGRGVKGEGSGGFGSAGGRRDARINADRFAGLPPGQEPDSEDEATAALIHANPAAVWPMGIMRIDRKEEKKALATTAELEAQEQAHDEDIFVGGEVYPARKLQQDARDEEVWHAAPHVPVDSEPGDDNIPDVQPINFDAHDKKPPPPDFMEIDSKSVSPDGSTPVEAKPRGNPTVDPEVEALARDLKTLLSELGPSEEGGQQRDGRLYLFQFPPVLPPLKPADDVAQPEQPGVEDDVKTAEASNPGDSVDLAKDSASGQHVKPEPLDEKVTISDMAQQLAEGGLMGKLNVRRSGKVELDWGGRILELAPATHLNFLTKAVLVEQSDEKPKPGDYGGEAFDMGKVMGRFVLAPVWGDEEDWVVEDEDLEYD